MLLEYYKSVFELGQIPKISGQVMFVGRSNVGKSSLINAIAESKVCFTSKMPGRTVGINLFTANKSVDKFVVDVPGYGFAKANEQLRQKWHQFIPEYLKCAPNIYMVYVLVDSRRGIADVDNDMVQYLTSINCNFSIVFTKIDKLNNSEMEGLKAMATACGYNCYMVSSSKNMGDMKQLKQNVYKLLKD